MAYILDRIIKTIKGYVSKKILMIVMTIVRIINLSEMIIKMIKSIETIAMKILRFQ